MIDITFDEIGEHIEKGDLKAWLSELKVVDAMKHLRMYEPQTDCSGCRHYTDGMVSETICNDCKRSYTDNYEPQTERSE